MYIHIYVLVYRHSERDGYCMDVIHHLSVRNVYTCCKYRLTFSFVLCMKFFTFVF